MIFRRIGDTDINCSILGLGTGRMASVSGGLSRTAAIKLIATAADCGINLIDTADSYAQGQCEKMIAPALQGKRSQFVITTKAGYCFSTLGGGLRLLKPLAKRVLKYFKGGKNLASNVRSNVSRQDFTPQAIRDSVVASLQRLQTDYIDIFLLHSPPLVAISDPELGELLRRLKQEGKIRHFGVSSPDTAVLQSALKVAGLSVVQTPISPVQMVNPAVLTQLQSGKIGVIANQVFSSGKLVAGEPAESSEVKKSLDSFAAAKGISLQRLLIKFALAQSGVMSVLSGTTNPEHLKQNVAGALSADVLSAQDLDFINNLR
jgi:aryl-alcohol dehydrogenase-like predicted oxidoreductase